MEIFKDIAGYEGLYQVSNLGNVKSLGNGQTRKERILKRGKNKWGYVLICLHNNGISKTFTVHRLVAKTFLENLENKPQVNHINGIKDDNRLENLEFYTRSENQIHSYRVLGNKGIFQTNHPKTRLGKFGKDNKSSKKVNQFNLDGKFIKTWFSIMDIERELGINNGDISSACKGKLKTAGKFIWKYKED